MNRLHRSLLPAVLCFPMMLAATTPASAEDDSPFETLQHEDADGATLLYRLLKPTGEIAAGKKRPLLLFLHGAGERGSDNEAQLQWGKELMLRAAREHGAFVLAPQCPRRKKWHAGGWGRPSHTEISEPTRLVMEVIAKMQKEHPIDTDRIYVMGLSMGGYGSWHLIQRYPDMFAAAVPICGGGDPTNAERIKTPVWVFHGAKDSVVPVGRSREMVEAIRAAGGKPKYTEYPELNHNSWTPAFEDPELLKWLFSQ